MTTRNETEQAFDRLKAQEAARGRYVSNSTFAYLALLEGEGMDRAEAEEYRETHRSMLTQVILETERRIDVGLNKSAEQAAHHAADSAVCTTVTHARVLAGQAAAYVAQTYGRRER